MSDILEESNEELTKEQVIFEIRECVVEPFIKLLDPDAEIPYKVSVGEFLKGQEMICKLSGFYDSNGSGQDLPKEARLKIP